MKAFVQPLTGIVRAGPDCDQYGKPWDYAVTFASVGDGVCTLMALKGDGNITMAHWRATMIELRKLGFTKVRWERRKTADGREIETDIA